MGALSVGDLAASVRPMLEARSVAVVGASARSGSFGETLMVQLLGGGFEGEVHPVNPRYREVMGRRCAGSLAELAELRDRSEPLDLVILGVSNALLEEQLAAAAAVGARSAVVFASCAEPARKGRPPLAERLRAIASDAGMSLCGGNGMGFVNFERGLRACGYSEPLDRPPGGIAFVSHSGSAFSALLHNDRGLRFNLAVSPGLELVTTAAGYLAYALELPSTRVLALFLETIRDPERFRHVLAALAERDVPVVALKVGGTGRAREMVAAHSGALAGEAGAYQALFDAYGVCAVRTMDEMADTLELFAAGRRAGPGGLAAIHDSGGERAHLIDVAEEAGVALARISERTRGRLASVLDEGLPAVNPLDAWGTANDAPRVFEACMQALLEDPDTAALAFCVDMTSESASETKYTRIATEVHGRTGKPFAMLSNLASAIDPDDARFVRDRGIPVLEGTLCGLRAFGHLFAHRDARALPAPVSRRGLDPALAERWRARLASGIPLDEAEALALIEAYGVPVIRWEVAGSAERAAAAAARLGWPVVLKTAAPGVGHKSEVDGVRTGLPDQDAVARAYADLSGRLGPRVMVQAAASPGVELALGLVADPQFGTLVMAAAGGTLVQVLRDRRFGLPPLDAARALAMLDRLSVRHVLAGIRGRPPADLESVAGALVGLSRLAEELGRHLAELDVNPLVAGPNGCVAVDALAVPRPADAAG